jgi:hypothetical protein
MIELEINGAGQRIEPGSIGELREQIQRTVPTGHGLCQLIVDGRETSEISLEEYQLSMIRRIEVVTESLVELARKSVDETRDWIGRICQVLDSIAGDYRMGRERDAASRLVEVIDALQVLIGLLSGIHLHLRLDGQEGAQLDDSWDSAELALRDAIEALATDIQSGDPIRLADKTGYVIPRCLGSFHDLLGKFSA